MQNWRKLEDRTLARTLALLLSLSFAGGCSLRTLAVNEVGNVIAGGGSTFTADDDPDLVGQALPFTLKLIESLLEQSPNHRPLLVAAARGFMQYSYGWVDQTSDELEEVDPAAAAAERERAKRLYLRARKYALRALGEDFEKRLMANPASALARTNKNDVPALYWAAASWGLAIARSMDDLEMLADLPITKAMIDRAAELEPGFGEGSIDSFLMSYDAAQGPLSRDASVNARTHFDRAVQLSQGKLASPFVSAAEIFALPSQNRGEFEELLNRALAVDTNARPEWRLENVLAQRRARWLLSRADELFLDSATGDE